MPQTYYETRVKFKKQRVNFITLSYIITLSYKVVGFYSSQAYFLLCN